MLLGGLVHSDMAFFLTGITRMKKKGERVLPSDGEVYRQNTDAGKRTQVIQLFLKKNKVTM